VVEEQTFRVLRGKVLAKLFGPNGDKIKRGE
jgi:hypothetical protein